jgi:hypothetical protein
MFAVYYAAAVSATRQKGCSWQRMFCTTGEGSNIPSKAISKCISLPWWRMCPRRRWLFICFNSPCCGTWRLFVAVTKITCSTIEVPIQSSSRFNVSLCLVFLKILGQMGLLYNFFFLERKHKIFAKYGRTFQQKFWCYVKVLFIHVRHGQVKWRCPCPCVCMCPSVCLCLSVSVCLSVCDSRNSSKYKNRSLELLQ